MYTQTIFSILQVLVLLIPILLVIAFVTIAERKTMASMQRRVGPNIVGFYGLLQAFADALKLLLKEYVAPSQADLILFFVGPTITLIFSLLAFSVMPYGPGITVFNFDFGILYILAVSSISTYGILLAGWSANSKYAFLGSLRSTAQLISYELILTSAILLLILISGSLNLITNVEIQKIIWFVLPLMFVFIIFLIASVAETNRAPFDLAEAESELVSGFMTEHSSVVFVFFFLAEYGSVVLMCMLISLFFFGGYLENIIDIGQIIEIFYSDYNHNHVDNNINDFAQNIIYALSLGYKTCIMIFIYIWIRASFPRIRYDQLMEYSWMGLLPIVVAFFFLMPAIIYAVNIVAIVDYCL